MADRVLPTDFALQAATKQAEVVEAFVGMAHMMLREIKNPEFIVNSLFGATITFAHDTGADPHQLQTAFRKMSDLVFQVYAQRDKAVREIGARSVN